MDMSFQPNQPSQAIQLAPLNTPAAQLPSQQSLHCWATLFKNNFANASPSPNQPRNFTSNTCNQQPPHQNMMEQHHINTCPTHTSPIHHTTCTQGWPCAQQHTPTFEATQCNYIRARKPTAYNSHQPTANLQHTFKSQQPPSKNHVKQAVCAPGCWPAGTMCFWCGQPSQQCE